MKKEYTSIYEPAEDSFLMINSIIKFIKNKKNKTNFNSALDVGTGSGIIAEELAKHFKKVIGIDKNKKAIEFCKKKYKNIKNLRFFHSDLLKNIPIQKFDLIVFNPPYLPEDKEFYDSALHGGKEGWETIDDFLKQVGAFLGKDSRVLLLFSTLTNKKKVKEIIKNNSFEFECINEKKLSFEKLFVYELTPKRVFLTKGKRGYVYIEGNDVIKQKNPNSTAGNTIKNEIRFLIKLKGKNIAPDIIEWDEKDFLWFRYKYIRGEVIVEYIKSQKNKEKIKDILIKLLKQSKKLDDFGINKFEMTHPQKHVIVDSKEHVWFIDFERARETENPKNVTQTIQFISSLREVLSKRGISINIKKLFDLSKKYKNAPQNNQKNKQKVFKEILSEIK